MSDNTDVSIEFNGQKNIVYFIKIQPNSTATAKIDLYFGISNGAEISITSLINVCKL